MATVVITINTPDSLGQEAVYVPAEDGTGFTVPNNGATLISIRNNNLALSSVTITLTTPYTLDGLALADRNYVLHGQETVYFNRLSPAIYNNSAGNVLVTLGTLAQNGAASAPTFPNVSCLAMR